MPLRVMQILPAFIDGGAEHVIASLLKYIDRSDFDTAAVCLCRRCNSHLEHSVLDAGIEVFFLDKRPGFDPAAVIKLLRIINTYRPNVIHTHICAVRYALAATLHRHDMARVHTMHCLAEKEATRVGRMIERVGFRLGMVPVALGEEVASSVKRVYGLNEVPIVRLGISMERYGKDLKSKAEMRLQLGLPVESLIVVCVGRLCRQKNHLRLLKSFRALGDQRAHLLLVGDGELKDELAQDIASLGLSDRVHMLGLRSDVPEIMAAADVFALSSDYEGTPISIMEAMASGLPVVATDVGGVSELVAENVTGFLVERENADGFSRALNTLLSNEQLRRKMGEYGRKRAHREFDIRSCMQAYQQLYVRLVGWCG